KGQRDRSLLDDRVDVMSPGVAVEKAVDRELQLIVHPPQEPPNTAWWLPAAVGDNADVLLPDSALVESTPDRSLCNVQAELGLALRELDDIRLNDRWNRISAGAHAAAVDLIT